MHSLSDYAESPVGRLQKSGAAFLAEKHRNRIKGNLKGFETGSDDMVGIPLHAQRISDKNGK